MPVPTISEVKVPTLNKICELMKAVQMEPERLWPEILIIITRDSICAI